MKTRKLYYEVFSYMSEMINFFNDHPEYELIAYSYKTKEVLTAVYYVYNKK